MPEQRELDLPGLPDKVFYRIGEVASATSVKPYVLRFWESEFPSLRPQKSRSGQRRYRRKDVELIVQIRDLLWERKFTIPGARDELRRRAAEAKKQRPPVQQELPAPADGPISDPASRDPYAALTPLDHLVERATSPSTPSLDAASPADLDHALRERDRFAEQLRALRVRLADQEASTEYERERAEAAEADVESLRAELRAARAAREDAEHRAARAEETGPREGGALRAELDRAAQEERHLRAELERLRTEAARQKTAAEVARQESAAARGALRELEEELETTRKRLDGARDTLEEYRRNEGALRARGDHLQEDQQRLAARHERLRAEHAALREHVRMLEEAHAALDAAHGALRDNHVRAVREAAEARARAGEAGGGAWVREAGRALLEVRAQLVRLRADLEPPVRE